jgi:hypothetical protein
LVRWTLILAALGLSTATPAQQPPAVPVGVDAYTHWDWWPYQRIGVRAYMRSTYDRSGGNEGADASHFLYQLAPDRNVSLDVQGTGELYFCRYNHWHGSPWHYEVDGVDNVVTEDSTATPNSPIPHSGFQPSAAFPKPLALTWADTQGADLSWVPIGFRESFRMSYERTHYGTGYYIYHLYPRGTGTSRPITSWKPTDTPPHEVLDLLNHAGKDPGTPFRLQQVISGFANLAPGKTITLITLSGPAMLHSLVLSAPRASAVDFGRARLRIAWDGRTEPSVDAPLALFFGAGTLYNRDGREYLVKALPVNVRFDASRVYLTSYLPAPFFESAKIELVGGTKEVDDVQWEVRSDRFNGKRSDVGYFHATYQDFPSPEPGKDLVLLDTRKTEGGGDWSGQFIGTSFIFSHNAVFTTLEGDPRFFFDDSQTPQAQGTGTEEWGGGGDYWGSHTVSLPLAGHPVGASSAAVALSNEDKIESAYRFLLADLMPFGTSARICLEHGGQDDSIEHYETVTYWYGAPAPSLVKTDSLQIGDAASEKAHRYLSPDASRPYAISSRYEWGVDHLNGREVFPATTDTGRVTTGSSEFTLAIKPQNFGVMLRRKLDYAYEDQQARVYVADPHGTNWQLAGTWYLAGCNTCIYSNPSQELGPSVHTTETSNRRFRDDEFMIPRDLTKGRASIRVKVVHIPLFRPLYPGAPWIKHGWSEIRYDAYSVVLPRY